MGDRLKKFVPLVDAAVFQRRTPPRMGFNHTDLNAARHVIATTWRESGPSGTEQRGQAGLTQGGHRPLREHCFRYGIRNRRRAERESKARQG